MSTIWCVLFLVGGLGNALAAWLPGNRGWVVTLAVADFILGICFGMIVA